MKAVDKLLQRANDLASDGLQVSVCLVIQDIDSGIVNANISLWDGVEGSGYSKDKRIIRVFDTPQDAYDYIDELVSTHPPTRGQKRIEPCIISILNR